MKNTKESIKKNKIVEGDLLYIYNKLSDDEKNKLKDSTILITGCGGFLGYYFMHFFSYFGKKLQIKKVIGVENFLTTDKQWLEDICNNNSLISLHKFDIISDSLKDIELLSEANFVIHAASVASPSFYRKYPLETLDANVIGLRRLLDYYLNKPIKGFLFLSSSEIYGDPFPEFIPTKESYRGNVSTTGPRACYDEAKRFGETLCYIFANQYNMPISIARPFNNYGPGMSPHDKRLPADFAKSVLADQDLIIFSDGKPTRTFCYVSDAITGYLKTLIHGKFNTFNIGIDLKETSVREFAEIFAEKGKEIFNYSGKVCFVAHSDKNYLKDNPNRRCPDISKARKILKYNPEIEVAQGVRRYLEFLKINKGKL
jgi:UDP-glucuronate decarboxylase